MLEHAKRWQWWVALVARGLVTVVWAVYVAVMVVACAFLDAAGRANDKIAAFVHKRWPAGVREALRQWGEG